MNIALLLIGISLGWLLSLVVYSVNRLSAQRRDRSNQAKCGYDRTPKPLPMRSVESSQRFKVAGGCWPLLIGHEDDATVWVVLKLDELPRPPASESVDDSHAAKCMAGGAA